MTASDRPLAGEDCYSLDTPRHPRGMEMASRSPGHVGCLCWWSRSICSCKWSNSVDNHFHLVAAVDTRCWAAAVSAERTEVDPAREVHRSAVRGCY